MRPFLFMLLVVLSAACNKSNFDKEIVGVWVSEGAPTSSSLPEKLRNSASWKATLEFKPDRTFNWSLDNASGGQDKYAGNYSVVGFSLEIEITEFDGKELTAEDRLSYRVRQQATGSIRLPLPQDWTGPSVDYFPRP